MRAERLAALAAVGILLGGCASTPPAPAPAPGPVTTRPDQDGAPARPPPDLASIPDAIPRAEPRSARGNPPFYEVFGHRYYVKSDASGYRERGVASWYGTKFHGRSTSSGEPYDMYAMTAAHKTLPLPSYVRVTHVGNGRSVVVRVNDRGPFVGDRIIDLSYAAAVRLGMHLDGTALVDVELIEPDAVPGQVVTAAVADPEPLGAAEPTGAIEPVGMGEPAGRAIWLQVGAFSDAQNAARLEARLASAGIEEVATSSQRRGASTVHRVRVGPLGAVAEAERMLERLRSLGFGDAHVSAD